MLRVSRRRFLGASAAVLGAPLWSKASRAANPDVVVIGAGAAGIAAAQRLLREGLSVTVIEASNRLGGRVLTDSTFFGVPCDFGARWLHYGEANPFVAYGKKHGFTLYPAPDEEILYVGDREATAAEYEAYARARGQAVRAMLQAGDAGRDVSPADVVPDAGVWRDLVHLTIGPYEMAKDLDRFSCLDWYNSSTGTDWYCKEGLGALWTHAAGAVPVAFGNKAEVVKWGGPGVRVETARGTIAARACIVTVSTGVLAKEGLRFDPPLSSEKQDSFHAISMGLYNRIALQFRDNFFGVGDDGYLLYKPTSDGSGAPRGLGLLTNVSGSNLTYADVGGGFARELEAAGPDASIDFALSELRGIFGAEVDRNFIKGYASAWGKNGLTEGSYASAEPGAYKKRALLRAPVGERIWFAGEACSRDEWGTVAGAHKSGDAVAAEVITQLT